MTNDDGEVSWYENLPVAKQKITEAEVQGDLKVHGEIANRGVCTAWVNFDGTQNPPLIRDSFNVKDVVDAGTGLYDVILNENINTKASSYTATSANTRDNTSAYPVSGNIRVSVRNDAATYSDASSINLIVFGGKEIR